MPSKGPAVQERTAFPCGASAAPAPAIALAVLCLLPAIASCATAAKPPSGADFYEGLLKRQRGAETEAVALFKRALSSPNPHIAAAAAAELLGQRLTAGLELSAAEWDRIGAAASGSWAGAFRVLDGAESAAGGEEALALLLSRSTSAAVLHAMREWRLERAREGELPPGLAFSAAESAALDGRAAAARSRWRDALAFFRRAMAESPCLFFRHPDLLSDLGRAFQFGGSGREGIDLFLEWEAIAAAGEGAWQGSELGAAAAAGSESLIRFQLLFFAGRIARQRGLESIALFERALPFAKEVSPLQSDAAIWYILRAAVDQGPEAKIGHLERHVSSWSNDLSFFDVMDRLSRQLILDWQWGSMMRVFEIVRERQSGITAKFAWIIARAIQEGFIEPAAAAEALRLPAEDPVGPLMRIAFESSGRSLYYRLMSAMFLGEEFLALPEAEGRAGARRGARGAGGAIEGGAPEGGGLSSAAQFLLGFFENSAAEFAIQHIRAMEGGLSLAELRPIAEALAAAGNYLASITLITRYTRRETFHFSQMTRRDWELWYPRPFWGLIERYAKQVGLEPALMLALIRAESAFMPSIVSHAGAVGLTQLMPATAEETAARIRRQGGPDFRMASGGVGGTNLNLNDPAVNIHIGTVYLGILEQRLGDPMLALLAYNGGTGRVRSWLGEGRRILGFDLPIDLFLETVPFPETRNYGRGVTSATEVYRKLYFR